MIQVDQITDEHIGRRVVFKRPASSDSPRAMIAGKLIALSGSSGARPGYNLTIDYNGCGDVETFGPVPGTFPIDVQHKWRKRYEPEFIIVSPFPDTVKRVRVRYLGGTLDGTREDIAVDDFHGTTTITKDDPDDSQVQLYFEPGSDLIQIKGGLWWGKWRLVRSIDFRKPFSEYETKYVWPT